MTPEEEKKRQWAAEKAWKQLDDAFDVGGESHSHAHVLAAQKTLEEAFGLCDICGLPRCESDHK
jgi:hypothetical protein